MSSLMQEDRYLESGNNKILAGLPDTVCLYVLLLLLSIT